MKQVFLFFITLYQRIISPGLLQLLGIHAACRYSLSCSEYARIAIIRYGILKGTWFAGRRLLSCQPFFSLTVPDLQK